MTDLLEQKAVEIIGQLQHLAPRATELALETARIDAIGNLVFGFIALVYAVAGVFFWTEFYWPWVNRKDQDDVDGPIVNFVAGVALAIALAVLACMAITGLCNIWNWVGLFHPELFLAHKMI